MRFIRLFVIAVLGAALVLAAAPADKKAKGDTSKKTAGDAAKGQEIFKSNCSVCHYADKTDKRIGPGLQGLFTHEKLQNGKPVNDENVRNLIENGSGKMLPFKEKLDKKQIDDVIAFLHTL